MAMEAHDAEQAFDQEQEMQGGPIPIQALQVILSYFSIQVSTRIGVLTALNLL
jgi:hypothetical protein